MKQIYKTICLYFFYWLSENSSLRECLEEGMEQLIDDAFWDAIEPLMDKDYRLDRMQDELMRVYLHGIVSRAKVVDRRHALRGDAK